jgi:hypothetical protein
MGTRSRRLAMAVGVGALLVTVVAAGGCRGSAVSPSDESPRIAAIEPASGPVETQVVLEGSGFLATGNTVRFGSGYLRHLDSPDGKTLRFRVPDGLDACGPEAGGPCSGGYQRLTPGRYELSVITSEASSNTVTFTVTETR